MADGPVPDAQADSWWTGRSVRAAAITALTLGLFVAIVFVTGRVVRTEVAAGSEPGPVKSIELTDLIRQVKRGLADAQAQADAAGELKLFRLKDFELEVNVVARGEGKTSAKLWTVGSEVTSGSEKVQKIHLRWIADPERNEGIAPPEPIDAANVVELSPRRASDADLR